MYDIKHCKTAPETKTFGRARKPFCLVRGVSCHDDRCRHDRLHSFSTYKERRACFVGAGPHILQGNWQSVFTRIAPYGDHSCRCKPACRCALGGRGRIALQGAILRDWRNLGRPACADIHRDKATGDARRGTRGALLVGAPRSIARSECGARPLAYRFARLNAPSTRPPCPWCAALAGRAVSFSHASPRYLGGKL